MTMRLRAYASALFILALSLTACAETKEMDHAASGPSASSPTHAMILLRPDDAKFMPVPGVSACMTLASLRGDASKGPATFATRLEAGCVAPWHWHSATEESVLLKGQAVAQMKGAAAITLPTGSYAQFPSHHAHRYRCLPGSDCIIVTVADQAFDIHWVDAAGNEITFDKAVKLMKRDGKANW